MGHNRHHGGVDPVPRDPVDDVPPVVPAIGEALVSTPVIGDPTFATTVILLVHHDAEGAMGLVLNRATPIHVAEALPLWHERVGSPPVVFEGGPVNSDHALGLGLWVPGSPTTANPTEAFTPLPGQDPDGLCVGIVDLSAEPTSMPPALEVVRVFGGYAGWGPGQLESELSVGAWWSTPIWPHEVLTGEPETLWERVVARQRGTRRLFARFPTDPGLN